MLASVPDKEVVRVVFLVAIAVLTLISQVMKQKGAQKPPSRPAQPSPADAWRQVMEQLRARRQQKELSIRPEAQKPFAQPEVIQPESSFLPSILLIALVIAVAALVYRALAG